MSLDSCEYGLDRMSLAGVFLPNALATLKACLDMDAFILTLSLSSRRTKILASMVVSEDLYCV